MKARQGINDHAGRKLALKLCSYPRSRREDLKHQLEPAESMGLTRRVLTQTYSPKTCPEIA